MSVLHFSYSKPPPIRNGLCDGGSEPYFEVGSQFLYII